MFFDLSGKRAFITGGASGIGLAVARRFAEAGARVVIADMQDGQAVATELGGTFVHLDVSDSAAMLAALAQNCEQDGKLDILINNAGINGADLKAMVAAEPEAELFIHPECGCATSAMYLASSGVVPMERTKILSTSGMVTAAEQTKAKKVLVATETGMLHQLRKANPLVIFEPVNRAAVCKYMKMITPEKLLNSLRNGTDVVDVPRDIADKARLSVERMIAIGTPSRTKE